MKEALTEHLFTIIHMNEIRKAKKLEELVSKLDVENLSEFEIPEPTKPTTPTTPTTPTSPVQSIPPQTAIPDQPPESNGIVQPSGAVPQETQQDKGDSTVNTGEKTSSVTEEQSQNIAENTSVIKNEESNKETNVSPVGDKSSSKDDMNSSNETDTTPASDQPEAEQHVQLNTLSSQT